MKENATHGAIQPLLGAGGVAIWSDLHQSVADCFDSNNGFLVQLKHFVALQRHQMS